MQKSIITIMIAVALLGCGNQTTEKKDPTVETTTPLPDFAKDTANHKLHSSHLSHIQQFAPATPKPVAYHDSVHKITERTPATAARKCKLSSEVYGYHASWMGSAWKSYDYSLISTLSYFTYTVDPATGSYKSIGDWKTTGAVEKAHAAGCRVELSVSNLTTSGNEAVLNDSTKCNTLIDSLIALVKLRNADGVCVDFELVPGKLRDKLTGFMQELCKRFHTEIPGSTVSLCLYAIDWSKTFDISALDKVVDRFIIMGYDYHYAGSSVAGPVAPLEGGKIWGAYTVSWSIKNYLGRGATPSKLLLAVPYYGREWETAGKTIPSKNEDAKKSKAVIYKNMMADKSKYKETFDSNSETPYFEPKSSPQPEQLWSDDAKSLGLKYDLVKSKKLGGIGIFCLGYDHGYDELWQVIQDKFGDCGEAK